ncbi:MAG: Galactose-1-phosphate uridylyltransferase [Candidatus Berkelbacteria bacterium Licking1014_96]|uniref:Galactose-1-phosphate uridylyltransferase n=1 Tax=Candidatus Berkelbacteria bacterium Licking1014_96 TaxID=2017149 RepID=A0A554LH18_9BACT|nr:MAG: Galactose-1-phosphate uridylyltransferase [Candidatus Berkelbacteria bacterium Licking1014_96]
MPKLRQNIITGDWVVISPERAKRPEDFVVEKKEPKTQSQKDCPFCPPEGAAYKNKIKGTETKNLYVIPNKFPAFVDQDEVIEEGGDFYPSYKSLGGHEVISFKDHNVELPELKSPTLVELFDTYRQRMVYHQKNPVIEYVMIVHNFGAEAGASIDHPHSQLFASSIIPTYVTKELFGSRQFYKDNKECVYCRLIEEEQAAEVRIIAENANFIAFTFFAARFPFEVWLLPKKHSARYEIITQNELEEFVEIFLAVMKKISHRLNDPPYNYFIHTAPAKIGHHSIYYHWHLEICPRVSKLGAYEIGSDVFIDVVSPESAAAFLRKAHE